MRILAKEATMWIRCSCGNVFQILEKYRGRHIRCGECHCKLAIPKKKTATPLPPASISLNRHKDLSYILKVKAMLQSFGRTLRQTKSRMVWSGLFLSVALLCGLLSARFFDQSDRAASGVDQWELSGSDYQELAALPATTSDEIAKKIEALDAWQKNYKNHPLEQSWELKLALLKRQATWQAAQLAITRQNQALQDKNPWRAWLLLASLAEDPPDERLASRLKQHKEQVRKRLLQAVRSHAGETTQLIQERRLAEAVARTTPRLLRLLGEAWDIFPEFQDLKPSWEQLLSAYEQIPTEDKASLEHELLDEQLQFKYYQKYFNQYLKKFKQWMLLREYDLAQQGLENLWESLHGLEHLDSEDMLLKEIREKLKEVQSVKAFFSVAHEGAKAKVGMQETIVLKNGTPISGKILYYGLGYFEIQISPDKKNQVSLKQLRPEDIVRLALSYKKNKFLYACAGIFYWNEGKNELSRQCFDAAMEAGADAKDIQQYLQKLQETPTISPTNATNGQTPK